jgi:Gram-negative bacterial TonB protein C-terminal/CarboxypepD_reg-like domain
MKKYNILLVMLVLFFCNDAAAQFVKVSGRVTDFTGKPVAMAAILFKGNRYYHVLSDSSGNFTTVRNSVSDTTIVCRHVNFKTIELKVENANTINFTFYPKEEVHTLGAVTDSLPAADDLADMAGEKRFVDSFLASQSDKVFTRVEMDPYFDGGYDAVKAYYRVSLRREKIALKQGINGVVTIGFLVKKDGSISNVRLIKGINKQIDDAVVKLTRLMPKWRPALQNGKHCDYDFILSIPINLKVKPA